MYNWKEKKRRIITDICKGDDYLIFMKGLYICVFITVVLQHDDSLFEFLVFILLIYLSPYIRVSEALLSWVSRVPSILSP